jgi:hypothetical protein
MITRKWLGALAGLLALAGLVIAWGAIVARAAAGSQATSAAVATPQGPQLPRREIQGGPQSPAISFIDSPSATCYRPVAGTGECYIEWNYLYVTASSSQYVISMTVSIDGRLRAYHSGFFQTSMYIPGDMYDPGFRVICGFPGAGGVAGMGNTYSYILRARETGGLSAANYGSVTCPADVVQVFMPLVVRH